MFGYTCKIFSIIFSTFEDESTVIIDCTERESTNVSTKEMRLTCCLNAYFQALMQGVWIVLRTL